MTSHKEDTSKLLILDFLLREGLVQNRDEVHFHPLAGDGSSRRFFIISAETASYCAVLPDNLDREKGTAEALAAFNIGRHLHKRGIAVPRIFSFDPDSGLIIFENLGDTLLHGHVKKLKNSQGGPDFQAITALYKEIAEILLFMQISGSVRFNRKWCWDTERYNKKLMLEKESGYFLQSLCIDLLGIKSFDDRLSGDFRKLAGKAARQPAVYFLHRDFQSRNIMLTDGIVRIIDFQGGRLGPLGYDLASLLIDPYTELPGEVQQEVLEHYAEQLCSYGLDDLSFLKGYPLLALQRNLQTLGAFAFLGFQKKKKIFRQYIRPAALSLHSRLTQPETGEFTYLRQLSEQVMELIGQKKDSIFQPAE